ncbi:MAG: 4Fe-4S binding protein [Christensenellales bacterium]
MEKKWILETAQSFILQSPANRVQKEDAITQELCGLAFFDEPVFSFGDAGDPMFLALKQPPAVGLHFMLPTDWLPEAKTVISFFLPFTNAVKKSNVKDPLPSSAWLHARIEGQECIRQLCLVLKSHIEAMGYKVIVPLTDPRFWSKSGPVYTSNWSERHVAFVCGLGTFGLSKGLITRAGIAGRFGSLITDMELPYDTRPYTDLYEYCTRCGSCAKRCPVYAISINEGKLHPPCSAWVDETRGKYSPRYGCGKCQVAVPCESGIPHKP